MDKTNEFVNLSVGSNVVNDESIKEYYQKMIDELQKQTSLLDQILNKNEKEIEKTIEKQKETAVIEEPVQLPETPTNDLPDQIEAIHLYEPVIDAGSEEKAEIDAKEVNTNVVPETPAETPTESVPETPALNPVLETTMQLPQEEIIPVAETPVDSIGKAAEEAGKPLDKVEMPIVEEKNDGIIGMDDLLKEITSQPIAPVAEPAQVALPEAPMPTTEPTVTVPTTASEPIAPTIEIPVPVPAAAPEGPSPEVPVPSETVYPPEPSITVPTTVPEPTAAPVEPKLPIPAAPDANIEILNPAILDGAIVHADGQQRNHLVDSNEELAKDPDAKTLVKTQ